MPLLPDLSPEKSALLETLFTHLSAVPGVKAIVLGGSYARGTQRPTSDLDIGIYYSESQPFQIAAIRAVAEKISMPENFTITGFYEWGPWVNGGAWIHTSTGKVDFLYRNLDQVNKTIEESIQGITHFDYNQQPPYGFPSVIYLAETAICIPLFDPEGWIKQLKELVKTYPPRLKHRVVTESLWLCEFTIMQARHFATLGDIYSTAGCQTRVALNLTQALFAINEKYFISDKTALSEIASFPIRPPDYPERLTKILSHTGNNPQELNASVRDIENLWQEVVSLSGDLYKPMFEM